MRIPIKVVSDVHIEVVWEAVPPLRLDIFRDERRQCEEPWECLFAERLLVGPCYPQLVLGVLLHKMVFELVSLCKVLDSQPCPRVLRGEDEGDRYWLLPRSPINPMYLPWTSAARPDIPKKCLTECRGSGPENDIFSSSPKIIFECSNLLF